MSNPNPPDAAGVRRYNYSIPSLAPKAPPVPLRFEFLTLTSLLFLALFLVWGVLLVPLTGFQSDEVMFVYDLWHPEAALSRIGIQHHVLPSMLMPYLGAFKSWIYLPIFAVLGYSRYAVRLPMLLLAAVTIVATGRLLRRIQGSTAAAIGVLLLSTDVVWLVTAVFDWGPVVIQNFLLVMGLLFAMEWYEKRRDRYAFLTGVACGLALWNKALFLWNLSGIGLALLLLALPLVVRAWRWKAAGLLAAGLIIGAFPLLKFNVRTHGSTLGSTSHLALSEIRDKAWYLSFAMDGEAAPSANVDLENTNPDRGRHPLSGLAKSFGTALGETPSSWRFPVGLAVIIVGFIAGNRTQRKWILFFVLSGLFGWVQSAITPDAGRSIHHTVLFWINWYAAVALGFGCIAAWRAPASRWAVQVAAVILGVLGIATIAVDYGDLLRHSATTPWTDADVALASKLSQLGAHQAVTADWGIADVLALRSRNQIAVKQEEFILNQGNFDRDPFAACQQPGCYVVTHVPGKVLMARAAGTMQEYFDRDGFAKGPDTVVSDTHGTPAFVVFAVNSTGAETRDRSETVPAPTASDKPALLASPAVILTKGTTGRTTLTWQVPAKMAVEVHVGAPNGDLFASGKGPGQEQTGFWVTNGMQFFLQDVSDGKPRTAENTVSRVTVEVRPQ